MSIRWKMTLMYSGLLAALLVAFGLFLFAEVGQLMISNLDTSLTLHFEQAVHTAPALTAELASTQPGARPESLPTLERLAGPGIFLQIDDLSGHIVAASSNLGTTVLPPPQTRLSQPRQVQREIIKLPVAGLVPEATTADNITQSRFLLRSSLLVDTHGRTVGILEVAESLFIVDQVQDRLVDVLAVGIAVALVLAMIIGLWLAGRLLSPIAHITLTAQQIGSSNDLAQRIATSKPPQRDEVGRLAVTFDTMLERLETAFLAQQQFVADASHELKTPLTAILGHANVVRRHGTHHPNLAEEAIHEVIVQAEQMQRLIEDLLALAQVDKGGEVIQDRVSIGQLVQEVVKEFTPLAQNKSIQLTMTTQQDASTFVLGDHNTLKQVVINLVDNALKFTPTGGQVDIDCHVETNDHEQIVVLEVRDTGEGIASTEIPHIFERWYRVDKARTRAAGGSGLGLAIVQATAQRHGGNVSVESILGQGSVFQVRFPVLREVPQMEAMTNPMQQEHISLRRLWWVALLTILVASLVNVSISAISVAFFSISATFVFLHPEHVIGNTVGFLLLTILAFVLVGRFARRPMRMFRILAVVALFLSFLKPLAALTGLLPIAGMNVSIFWVMIAMHIVSAFIAVGLLTTLARE